MTTDTDEPTPLTEREPVRIAGGFLALIPLVTSGLALFDVWHPTEQQVTWLGLMAAALIGLVTSKVRRTVWSPAGHEQAVAVAVAQATKDATPTPMNLLLAPFSAETPVADLPTTPPPIHPIVGPVGGRSGAGTEGNN